MRVTWVRGLWESAPPVPRGAIGRVERELGIRFPASYRTVVAAHQGMQPEPSVFDFVEDGDLTDSVVGPLFHFLEGTEESEFPGFNLLTVYRQRRDLLPPEVIPFCQDPGGNVIAFDFRDKSPQPAIVFVDHEMPPVEHNRVWPVADTFARFLDRLHP